MDELKDARAAAQLKTVVRKLVDTARAGRTREAVMLDPRERLIVALDVSSVAEAEAMIARLGDSVVVLQDRLSARLRRRARASRERLAGAGKQVFVDMKLHDIGNTVAQGVKSIARLGATFPHRARLSADHARRRRRPRRFEAAHPRRHRAHLLRRRRPRRRRLRLHRAGAGRRARRAGARHRRRRPGVLGRGSRDAARRSSAPAWCW